MTPETSIVPDTEMKVSIHGVTSQMNTFRYMHGVILGELLMKHADNVSRTLTTQVDVCCGMSTSGVYDCGDAQLYLFWTKVTSKAGAIDVGEHALPRRRKAPMRFDIGYVKMTSRKRRRTPAVRNALKPMIPSNVHGSVFFREHANRIDCYFLGCPRMFRLGPPWWLRKKLWILLVPATALSSRRFFPRFVCITGGVQSRT